MNFKGYGEIENLYNNKVVSQAKEFGYTDSSIEWVVETKVDGSNFQCSIDEEDNFVVGSRSQIIGRGTDFMNYERAMRNEDVKNNLMKMKVIILSKYSSFNDACKEILNDKFVLTVFGELCGGFYRHKDVEKVKGANKIQGRIDYHPDNMWIPFDIKITNGTVSYLFDQTDVVKLCEEVHLPHCIIRYKGTFDNCIKYPNDFIDDTGNILWGLPLIEGNITEGVVIKPNVAAWFHNGQRVLFKNKNDKFKERICKTPKEPKEIIPMNELEKKWYETIREYITENRLMSVFSKVGEINQKSFGMILGMFLKDLYKDFDKEYKEEIEKLEKELTVEEFNLAKARKEISKEVSDFIRPLFIERLNN